MIPARPRTVASLLILLGLPLTGLPQPAPATPPAPRPESPGLINQLEGNWEVVYQDYPKKDETLRANLSLYKTWVLFRNGQPAKELENVYMVNLPSDFSYRRVDDSPWFIPGHGSPKLTADGTLEIGHPYFFLGHWGGASTVRPAGPDEMRGKWKYGDGGGDEAWHRVHPRITEIEYSSSITDRVPADGPAGRMKTTYVGPGNDMRGNRTGFDINLYGENLWGHHIVYVEGTDLEPHSLYPITSPTPSGKPENIIGLTFTGVFWPKASPGRKWLHLDGLKFPFQLEVVGYPAPELRFVRLVEGRYEAAPELNHGDEFYVEAVFKTVPAQPPGKVKVSWSDRDPREVTLTGTDNPVLFRSGPLRVEPPEKITP